MLARSRGVAACALTLMLASVTRAQPRSEEDPGSALALRQRCEAERGRGHFEAAVALCRAAVAQAPNVEGLVALSGTLSHRGSDADLVEARSLADRALSLSPAHPGALFQRVQVAALEHDLPSAEALLARVESSIDVAKAARAHALLAHLALDAGQSSDAMRHARRAVSLDPGVYEGWVVFARAAFDVDDPEALRRAAPVMLRLAPEGPFSHYVAGVVDVMDGNFGRARVHVQRARWLGMEPSSCDRLLAVLHREQPAMRAVLRPLGLALAAGASLLTLFALGALLGRLTLRRLERCGPDVDCFDRRGGKLLRRTYRGVLFCCGASSYFFLPLMGLLVASSAAAVLHASLSSGRLPISLSVAMLLFSGLVLVAVIEAAFLRPRERRSDTLLDLGANPALGRALVEVAHAVGVRPVTRVYITPGAEIGVVEEGGLGRLLLGHSERCMRLGIGMLGDLEVRELEALLAHAYGRLRSTGTAGGGLALSLDHMLALMEDALGESGAASFLNPAWLFLRGFRRAFRYISRGARHLQELLADRWAARAYGVDALAGGLRQRIAARASFEAHAHATLDEVVSAHRGLGNLYTYRTSAPPDDRRIDAAIERAWYGGGDDASLSPAARIARLSAIGLLPATGSSGAERGAGATRPIRAERCAGATRPIREDTRPAWTLFASREALETSMTDALRNDLAREGITVDGADELEGPIESCPTAFAE